MAYASAPPLRHSPTLLSYLSKFRLLDIMLAIMAIELIAGGIIVTRELLEARKIQSQIAQLQRFNAAVSVFHEKYNGLPGDLLSVQADRMGLPTSDGTPSHSDGDGKISSCSPGWQAAVGCETALFWSQLASSELIEGSFTANLRFADSRLQETELPHFYLPQSPLSESIYTTVWNSDQSMIQSSSYIPNGNYFELTAIKEVVASHIVEESNAISPLISQAIDKKIDDGRPLSGRIIVNGNAADEEGWSKFAPTDPLECVTPEHRYNTHEYFKAHRPLCHLAIAIEANDRDSE